MEKAESTNKAACALLLKGTRVVYGKHLVELAGGDRGNGAIPADETPSQSNLCSPDPTNTPTIDYARAPASRLLAAAKSSDKEAYAELSSRCVDSVYRKVFRIVRNREDSEDVVQEALIKAYTHLNEFRGSCTFSTWLMTIAINSALMLLRKRRRLSEVSIDQSGDDDQAWGDWEFSDPRPNAEMMYARRQAVLQLSRAVERLPLRYRSVLEQCYAKEQSMKEAADSLGITLSAIKSRLLRARLTVRSSLAGERISIAECFLQAEANPHDRPGAGSTALSGDIARAK